ncbi:hypothetical protein ZIOFF_032898 [Zingiber officinale]|uniref:Uncharacterized protein n=1 Tax=Zingiber officinale TaxID=94328 RepID=A0A8J5L602_ZINOF|nr:hypothetical protein ZIOFF_032898 [Zingiber officinale]
MEGWGGICKWKPQKYDPKSEEKICAHASGKYGPIKSTIDAEIHAVMNSMDRPWTPTEKDLLLLIQIEGALLQIQTKPNMKASHHLAGLITSWNNTQNWPAQAVQASFTQKNTTKDLIWPTLNRQQLVMSSTAFESWSLSAKSRKTTSDEEAIMKDKALTGKMPYQLSQKPDWTSGKPLCDYKQ